MRKGHALPLSLALLTVLGAAAAGAQATSPRRTPVVSVVERVSPSVVNISAESIVREVEAEVDANLKRAQALRQAVLARAFAG